MGVGGLDCRMSFSSLAATIRAFYCEKRFCRIKVPTNSLLNTENKCTGAGGDFSLKVSNLILAAYACASSGADIISMSFSGTKPSKLEEKVFSTMRTQYNILTVASAGSSGTSEKKYPASYPSILSVGAVARNSTVASFSQRNNQVNLAWHRLDALNKVSTRVLLPMNVR